MSTTSTKKPAKTKALTPLTKITPLTKADKKAMNEAMKDLVADGKIVVEIEYPKITEERRQALELKIDKARWKAIRTTATLFYGQLMMNLSDKLSYAIPTACTNGKTITWNPDFLEKMSDENVFYVLLHETDHCALGHLWRFDFTDKKVACKANQACDHVINLRLNSMTGIDIKMPDGGLADPKYTGLCEEEVYRLIPDPKNDGEEGFGDFESPGQEEGDGEGDCKDGKGGKDGKGKIKESLKDSWTRKIIAAAQACKSTSMGNMPGDIQRLLDNQMVQKVSWRDEMAHFLRTSISMRKDYTRSSRREAWQPIIYPRKKMDTISRCCFIRDTSGSVDSTLLSKFNALIEQCMSEMGNLAIVMDCDTSIGAIYEIGPGVEVPKTAVGNGGTDFREPFKKCAELLENGEEIAGLVYLTDGFGSMPEPADYPNFPVLWISITKDFQGPFGKTVFVCES